MVHLTGEKHFKILMVLMNVETIDTVKVESSRETYSVLSVGWKPDEERKLSRTDSSTKQNITPVC